WPFVGGHVFGDFIPFRDCEGTCAVAQALDKRLVRFADGRLLGRAQAPGYPRRGQRIDNLIRRNLLGRSHPTQFRPDQPAQEQLRSLGSSILPASHCTLLRVTLPDCTSLCSLPTVTLAAVIVS